MSGATVTPPAECRFDRVEADACFDARAETPERVAVLRGVPCAHGLVIDVCSPTNPWSEARARMLNHLKAGAAVVTLLDTRTRSASVYRDNVRPQIFEADQSLVLPDVLPGFAVSVAALFA